MHTLRKHLASELCLRSLFYIENIVKELLTTNKKDEMIGLFCDGGLQEMLKKMNLKES
jgi:hypothetical protein